MSEEEKQMQDISIRLQCLEIAARTCTMGEELIQKAQGLYDFVTNSRNI